MIQFDKETYDMIRDTWNNVNFLKDAQEKDQKRFEKIENQIEKDEEEIEKLKTSQAVLIGKLSVVWLLIGSAINAVAYYICKLNGWFRH